MQVTKSHTISDSYNTNKLESTSNSVSHITGNHASTLDSCRTNTPQSTPPSSALPRYALVTGASRGIGTAVASSLAQAGYNLYLCGHVHMKELDELAITLSEKHEILCRTFSCDLSDPAAVRNMFHEIRLLHLVVNNAGIDDHTPFALVDDNQFQKIMQTNFGSVYAVCKSALPLLLSAGEGRIINISSIFGKTGASNESIYAASKGAVNTLTKSLAKELAPSHIAVNAIAPGVIDTDMNRLSLTAEELNDLCERIPAGRMGTPEEIAAVVLMLAKAPLYLTGQIITVDGGMT